VAQSPPVAFGNRKRRFQRVGKCLTLPSSGADRAGSFRVRVKHLPTPGTRDCVALPPDQKTATGVAFSLTAKILGPAPPTAIVLDVLIQAITFG